MLMRIARAVAPRWLWRRLRAWKTQRAIARFRPFDAVHVYAGIRLTVHFADPLARGWYDHDWGPVPEIEALAAAGLRPGAQVFDLGAHQGVVAMLLAARVGPDGRVVAVEALPHNARTCELNRDRNGYPQVVVVPAAVADRAGEIALGFDLNAQVLNADSITAPIRVPAVTIDGLADQYGLPDAVLLDIEGFECQALRGASRTLAAGPAWCVEVHQGCGLTEAGGSVAELFSLFPAGRYAFEAWPEHDPIPRPVDAPSDCPPAGRFYILARPVEA
jgi:FkbM family methyltransferase